MIGAQVCGRHRISHRGHIPVLACQTTAESTRSLEGQK